MNHRCRIPICEHEDKNKIDLHLCVLFEKIERICGYSFNITSGLRCKVCNERAGGKKDSSHLVGKAIDIECSNSRTRFDIISTACILGVRRIGIAPDHIHIDIDESKDQEHIWLED